MHRLFVLCIFLLPIYTLTGQNHPKHLEKFENKNKEKRKYLESTVIIKLTPQAEEFAKKNHDYLTTLKKSKLRVESIEKMYPGSQAPVTKNNSNGEAMADISRIYILKYSAPFTVDEAVSIIEKTGFVEYAEPYYVDEVLVIPSDPSLHSDNIQFYLDRIRAFDAWNISKGDTNVTIGIVDTGVRFTHEDLKDNIKYNLAELNGVPGVDDDNDGYIDNFRGWDLGNNDNNPDATGDEHGTFVAGCASATTDNNIGMAGTGFKCKYLPVKSSADNMGGTISYGYQGLYYAALKGCKVVNLSWGGASGYSQAAQDLITYVAVNMDVAIIAAAGNSGKEEDFYPATYKHVLSVAASDTVFSPNANELIDKKATFATYGYSVDLCVQGRAVYSTRNHGGYDRSLGSSYSSPLAAGAAGIVRSKFPQMKAVQVIEQLRVTGDIIDTFPENAAYKEKIGRRLNMYKALTDTLLPAVRIEHTILKNGFGEYAFNGDTVKVYMDLINYLHPTANCKITLSSPSPYIKLIDSVAYLGVINTLDTTNNYNDPFILVIQNLEIPDFVVPFRVQFDDHNYYDYQHFKYMVNPSWVTLDTGRVALSISSGGRLGFIDSDATIGTGFDYQNKSLLYEGGLMIALNDSTVSDCVRGEPAGTTDKDFKMAKPVKFVNSAFADQQATNALSDTGNTRSAGVFIIQNSYSWSGEGHNKYIITEYNITNISEKVLDTLHTGIYADWDIMDASRNRADWDKSRKLGYVFSTETSGLYAGIRLLTNDSVTYFALDHGTAENNNINPNDGFPSVEKYRTLKNANTRLQGGTTGLGTDVSHVVGAKLYNLAPGESRKVAFAILAGDNLDDLKLVADSALSKYKSFNTGAVPLVENQNFCKGSDVTTEIKPQNGQKFTFYSEFPSLPLYTGREYIFSTSTPDTIFVTNRDSLYESAPAMVKIIFEEPSEASFEMTPNPLNLQESNEVTFTNTSANSTNYFWIFGDGRTSEEESPLNTYNSVGEYIVSLQATNFAGCFSEFKDTLRVINETPTATYYSKNTFFRLFPVPANEQLVIQVYSDIESLIIYNSMGEEVMSRIGLSEGNNVINIQELPAGMYIIRFKDTNGLNTSSFIKQ